MYRLSRMPTPAVSTRADADRIVAGAPGAPAIAGGTSPERGAELYEFVRAHGCRSCLELGFFQGAGSVYIGAALEANGDGYLTAVDLPSALELTPTAQEIIKRAGLEHRVEQVNHPSGYNWFLHDRLREQLRGDRYESLYDFVFLDGGHTWGRDALAFLLVDHLLKPGGWLLIDDLDWLVDDPSIPGGAPPSTHVQEIWDLLVVTHPGYDELRTDGSSGWAHKALSANPPIRTIYRQDLLGSARELARFARRRIRRA